MGFRTKNAAFMVVGSALLSLGVMHGLLRSQEVAGAKDAAQVQEKIARALSAGPASITQHATVAEPDGHGGYRILRPGTNDFTCMPGDSKGIGMPPCAPIKWQCSGTRISMSTSQSRPQPDLA